MAKNWGQYWRLYGGFVALSRSPYFGLAVVLSVISAMGGGVDVDWASVAFTIIPSLLGFSIGAFAILLVFSSEKFLRLISEGGRGDSLFISASATFVHFIVVQVCSLTLAMLGNVGVPLANILTMFGIYYSVFSALAACFVLFDIAQVYNRAASVPDADAGVKLDAEPTDTEISQPRPR
ncbi:MAG TPA: hypothetical protein VFF87_08765 [Hyphomicrobium sp.]|nr:hypothetical protein [Hyphomicrobium sp.]